MDARSKIRSVRRLAPVVLLLGLATAAAAAAQPLGDLTEFSFPEQSRPVSIAAGPDGRLWVTEGNGWLARVTTDGVVEQQSLPPWITEMPPSPGPIAAGPDGNLWIGDPACCAASDGIDWIERMATDGTGTPFAVPTSRAGVSSIAAGADGNLWFTEELGNQIGRITTGGQIVEFADGLTPGSWPQGISAGPDGNLWFAENATNKIGRITPDGTITEFSNGITGSSGLEETAPGPDGNVWFTNGNGSVGKITRAGAATEFPTPTSSSGPVAIAPGPDGNVWFTESSAGKVGRVTPDGTITEYPIGLTPLYGIVAGPDGNMWVTEWGDKVARIGTGAPPAVATQPTVSGTGVVGTAQTCAGTAWATYAGEQPIAGSTHWLLDGQVIAGAEGATYVPAAGDAGHRLSCRMTATYRLLNLPVSAAAANSVPITQPATQAPPPSGQAAAALQVVVRRGRAGARVYDVRCPGSSRACSAIATSPSLLAARSGTGHVCAPFHPVVTVTGTVAARHVDARFASCVPAEQDDAAHWLSLVGYRAPSLHGTTRVRLDAGIGPLQLAEPAARVERGAHAGRLLPGSVVVYSIGRHGSLRVTYDAATRISRITTTTRSAPQPAGTGWQRLRCAVGQMSIHHRERAWTMLVAARRHRPARIVVATGPPPQSCRAAARELRR